LFLTEPNIDTLKKIDYNDENISQIIEQSKIELINSISKKLIKNIWNKKWFFIISENKSIDFNNTSDNVTWKIEKTIITKDFINLLKKFNIKVSEIWEAIKKSGEIFNPNLRKKISIYFSNTIKDVQNSVWEIIWTNQINIDAKLKKINIEEEKFLKLIKKDSKDSKYTKIEESKNIPKWLGESVFDFIEDNDNLTISSDWKKVYYKKWSFFTISKNKLMSNNLSNWKWKDIILNKSWNSTSIRQWLNSKEKKIIKYTDSKDTKTDIKDIKINTKIEEIKNIPRWMSKSVFDFIEDNDNLTISSDWKKVYYKKWSFFTISKNKLMSNTLSNWKWKDIALIKSWNSTSIIQWLNSKK